jgi:hypothetical protein
MSSGNFSLIHFWMIQQVTRLESDCVSRRSQIKMSRNIRQIVRASNVPVKAELRQNPSIRRALSEVKSTAENCLSVIIDEQIKMRKACESEQRLKDSYGKLMAVVKR